MTDNAEDLISLNPEASAAAVRLQHDNATYHGKALRLYLEGKGCDGFYYGVTFDEASPEDLVFRQPGEAPDVIVDPDTFQFVRGSLITWVDDERGRGFLVENPNHRRFRGKFFKRQAWRDHLTGATAATPTPQPQYRR